MSGDTTGYENWVGRSIDVPRGWVGLPWEIDPRTCASSDFLAIPPSAYVVDRVESIGGQPWAYLAAGSQRFKLDAVDALGPPEAPPPDPATVAERWVGTNVGLSHDGRRRAIPWELDPAQAADDDWVRVPQGIYRVERMEKIGDTRWVWVSESPMSAEKPLPSVKFPAEPSEFP